jgi:hypothetical protein
MTMNVLTASVSGEDISDPASDRKIAKVMGLKPNNLIVSHVGLNIYNFRKNREHKLHDL